MVSLQKIDDSIFDEIYASFLAADDPSLTADDWRPLFTAGESRQQDGCGYALVDGSRVVGILGMRFSERRAESGAADRFCNLHSWIVHPDYRGHSLRLMRPALRMTDTTLTDFSPTPHVAVIAQKLGFRPLDATLKILPPWPEISHRRNTALEIVEDSTDAKSLVDAGDAVLLRDHECGRQQYLLVTDGEVYCLVIFSRIDRHAAPYCYVHYVSNPQLFAKADRLVRRQLLERSGGRYAAVDTRLLENVGVPRSFNLPVTSRQLFRPAAVAPRRVDSLYSEVTALRLSTMPSMRDQAKRLAAKLRRQWPWRRSVEPAQIPKQTTSR